MKEFFSFLVMLLAAIVLLIGLIYGAAALNLDVMRRYGTAHESARTDIYRENKSYVEGTIRDLRDLKLQYETCAPEHRDSIRSLIKQRSGELDYGRLPADLKRFLEDL